MKLREGKAKVTQNYKDWEKN